jgi:hypothetical protein
MRQHGGRVLVRGGGLSPANAACGFCGGLPVPAMPAQGGGAATVKIATIEDLTGLTCFTKFGTRKQRQLKQNCVTFKFR